MNQKEVAPLESFANPLSWDLGRRLGIAKASKVESKGESKEGAGKA